MMKTFSLPIGKGTQTVSLDEAHVLYDLHGNPVDAVADEQEAIRQALRHPIGSAPLKDVVQAGDTVARQPRLPRCVAADQNRDDDAWQ